MSCCTPKIRIVYLPRALADPATPAAARGVYQAAYDRISRYVLGRGADTTGLTVVTG
jgi:poly-gamma-glutamate synthesis protein (capsule biosynthesis protein)